MEKIKLTEEEILQKLESVFGKDPSNYDCLRCIKMHACDSCSAFEDSCYANVGTFDWLDEPYEVDEENSRYFYF